MENQIEVFKKDKTKNYYKYLKIFAILQRESNKVVRELWSLVKNALNDIMPNVDKEDEGNQQQEEHIEKMEDDNNEYNEVQENYEQQE